MKDTSHFFGFTLVEVVVVTALFAIMMIFAVGIVLYNNRFYENESDKIEAINETREIADRLNEYARAANALLASYTYNSVLYTTDATTVIFQLPALDDSHDIVEGAFDIAIVGIDPNNSNRAIQIIDPDPLSVRLAREAQFTNALSSFVLTYDDLDVGSVRRVTYDVVIEKTGRHTVTERLVGAATLRN